MAKTEETLRLENAIKYATLKMGTFGCLEVTIGFGGKERVDYMTYDTSGIFRCYEIKVSKSDFHSKHKHSFAGHYNYFVLTQELYDQVKDEIPDWVGCYVNEHCVKNPKKQDIDNKTFSMRRSVNGRSTEITMPWTEMLKDSFIRSLYRDSQKLYRSKNDKYINSLNRQISGLEKQVTQYQNQHTHLFNNLYHLLGNYTAGILDNPRVTVRYGGTIETNFSEENLQKHLKLLRTELCGYLAKVGESIRKRQPIVTKEE